MLLLAVVTSPVVAEEEDPPFTAPPFPVSPLVFDMDALIRHVQAVVKQAHGLELHPEVMRLGCFANSQAAAA